MNFSEAEYDPQPRISIQCLGNDDAVVVKAEAWLDWNQYEVTESSRRDSSDKSNPEIGVKLAVGRAIRQLGREILKDGQYLVREADKVRERQERAADKMREQKAENKPEVEEEYYGKVRCKGRFSGCRSTRGKDCDVWVPRSMIK